MGECLSRLQRSVALCALATAIEVIAFVYLTVALYFTIAAITSPAIAALATGGAALIVATAIGLMARRAIRCRPASARPARPGTSEAEIAAEIGRVLGDEVSAWTKSHPLGATGIALAAGFVVGMTPGLRRALRDLLR